MTALVLLHGVGETHTMWDPQREELGRRFQLLLPDLPGYGDSPGPFSLDAAVDALHALDRPGPVHVCGLSAGAMVALRWAARHPEDVAGLILSGVQVRPPRALLGLQAAVMRLIPARVFEADGGVTKKHLLHAMAELARADLRPDLGLVKARTLVVCGAKDRLNLAASRAAAAGIRQAELRIVPEAKHLWNQDLPELFNRTVTEWVQGK
ncbi:alpha/beta fold hydrolase [Paractinoplanes lichenicola]|uniref:Alpha/beta fold hydrolase n=1 Tax=Paractinoplanes lichenicola TaxID=2802976 RepID=A0ABS1VGR6_9ACTN|nr:alpha/beta hydrolase [Actinoplanes lichenicola]MBL7253901.1 alpha/beta fold hydrolase [Actinoplanes lichenicola]